MGQFAVVSSPLRGLYDDDGDCIRGHTVDASSRTFDDDDGSDSDGAALSCVVSTTTGVATWCTPQFSSAAATSTTTTTTTGIAPWVLRLCRQARSLNRTGADGMGTAMVQPAAITSPVQPRQRRWRLHRGATTRCCQPPQPRPQYGAPRRCRQPRSRRRWQRGLRYGETCCLRQPLQPR